MSGPTSAIPPILSMRGISKRFGGVNALSNVSLDIFAGEVQALVGENGAGKSTLMKILSGAAEPDSGEILVDGRRAEIHSPREAERARIRMIHQELALVGALSVAENICLGRLPRTRWRLVDRRAMRQEARRILARLGSSLDVDAPAGVLSIGAQQIVEIAKALSQDARILVMDEPTSALPETDAKKLLALVRQLKSEGVAIVYITHKMEEIYGLADRLTVLRDGKFIGTETPEKLPRAELIRWMVGRTLSELIPQHAGKPGAPLLTVRDLAVRDARTGMPLVDGVSLTLARGEILGLAGLVGSGNSELLGALFGRFGRPAALAVTINGRPFLPGDPAAAIRAGAALLTNDRKATGLVLPLSVRENAMLASLSRAARAGLVSRRQEEALSAPVLKRLHLRAASSESQVSTLSGGNQQKVALAKWLLTRPRLLLLDEPTRGVDVGAKHEIYELINALADEGVGILLVTSELPELLGLSDRILAMHRGRVTAEFTRAQATPEKVMAAATASDQPQEAA